MEGAAACDIAGPFPDQKDPTRAGLLSMWTAPTLCKRGLRRLLVSGSTLPAEFVVLRKIGLSAYGERSQ
jgi:hypothetical protein